MFLDEQLCIVSQWNITYININIIFIFSERLVESATAPCSQKTPCCEDLSSPRKGDTPGVPVKCEVVDGDDADAVSTTTSPTCCKELADIQCRLETKDLWDKFHELGTEMIITKTGRWGNTLYLCPFPGKYPFWHFCSRRLLKTLWQKKIFIIMNKFSFRHNVFNFNKKKIYLFRDLPNFDLILSKASAACLYMGTNYILQCPT